MFSSLGLDCYGLAIYVRLDEQCVEFLVPSLDKTDSSYFQSEVGTVRAGCNIRNIRL